MLPEDKSEAEPRQLVNMTAQDGCLPLRKINLTNKVALIRDLGHCPLETVAKNFREVKAYGLVVGLSGSKLDDVVYEGSHLSPSTCCRIRQQKELIKVDEADDTEGTAAHSTVHKEPEVDKGLLIVWCIATFSVAMGAFYLYHEYKASRPAPTAEESQLRSASKRRRSGDEARRIDMEEDIDLRVTPSPWSLYVIIGMFVLASTVALVGVLEPLFYMVPFGTARLPNYAFPCFYGSLEVRQVLLILFSIGLAFSWVVIRHNSKSWLLQDFLGVIFSIYMIKTLRLPNLMVICVLLVLLFFYDIFFVFVTPYLVPKGDSIMVEVARGGGSDEQIPMVLRVPHLSNEDISACFGEYSVLGFGDILIPGFLVAYVHSFDLIATQGCLYYVTSVTAYGVGLLVTFIGLYIMKMAQPALLYLVPATLIPVILIAWYRGELREIWYGLKPETPLPSEEEPETSTVPGKRKNSRDEEERHASSRPSTSTIETPTQTSVAPSPSAMFPVHRFPPRPLSLPVPYTPAPPLFQMPPRYF
ncbi:signal peptide peptidase-like 2B [Rhipicephalus sanguineus]|uniref:signal peptide peptidase-like 2B n=1 Tax=Rhipicephalus sanguineus TaxID=34632 RepID=UPI0020C5836C|nr:signal peptide peptidase-like 2B [Rhipicephalus sanguineus]